MSNLCIWCACIGIMPGKESIARKVAIPIQRSVWQELVAKLVGMYICV